MRLFTLFRGWKASDLSHRPHYDIAVSGHFEFLMHNSIFHQLSDTGLDMANVIAIDKKYSDFFRRNQPVQENA